jgi:isopentenyl diphosphate isomerase/L-lactate dehydrogenase-like FMN-dependent dehydrogenase
VRYGDLIEAGLARVRSRGLESYLDLGAETGTQNRTNRAYLESIVFEMRILGASSATTETSLFGSPLRSPVVASPLCASRVLESLGPWERPYLEQIAAGLADAGSLMMTGHLSLETLARVVDQGAPVAHIVHPYRDEERVGRHLRRAEELGCVAVGINVDGMFGCKARDEAPGPDYLGPQTLEQIGRFIEMTSLPFVIKGMLSQQDAVRARDLGAQGIIVSIYGGEAIDHAVPVLDALPRIRQAVPELTVLADSGFQRGTDVLKALALGADGVGIVTLLLVAVAADGHAGVRMLLELLNEELQRTMSYVGYPTIADIDPAPLRRITVAASPRPALGAAA